MINQTLHPDDTAIEHLRIRGPASAGNRVAHDLKSASPPSAGGESWVFVRKLEARGSDTSLAGKILQQIQHNLRRAEQGQCDENLIRFNNLTELLSALLIDLSSGRAGDRWYWQHWSHLFSLSKAEAVASLMAQHWESLNAVAAQLASKGALLDVWQSLDTLGAERLLGELAWRQGLALSSRHFQIESAPTGSLAGLALAERLIERWQPIFAGFEANDTRRQLASLLLAQEAAPLMLSQAPQSTMAGISRCFDAPPPVGTGHDALRPVESAGNTAPTHTSAARRHQGSSVRPAGEAPAASATRQSRIGDRQEPSIADANGKILETRSIADFRHPEAFDRAAAAQSQKPLAEKTTETQANSPPDPNPPAQTESAAFTPTPLQRISVTSHKTDADLGRFHTAEGGVFYLLNFLNRPEVQTLMGEFWQELPNGWGWLYRLAQTLQFNEEPALNEFFAQQLGLDSSQQLTELPPLPAVSELAELARRWYGKTRIWRPELLHLQAQIAFNPSHIDLYTSMNNVRLEIRLAGLDINPGWLPWLGRVVHFHYETGPS